MGKLIAAAVVCVFGLAAVVAVPVFVMVAMLGSAAAQAQALPPGSVAGIPPVLLAAYARAVSDIDQLAPGCTGLRWSMLAAIGQVESNHAAGHAISSNGEVSPPIIGIALDGRGGTAAIADTDGGRYDGDTVWDRAVGPMQFIPSSWAGMGVDNSGDGVADPNNVYDAAAAAVHLCGSPPRNLGDPAQLAAAIRGYNNSAAYVQMVLGYLAQYDSVTLPAGGAAGAAGAAIDFAMAQLGKPYVWGAEGPDSYDCSGLTMAAYAHAGVRLPRVSADQVNVGPPVGVHHVGIYLGGGRMVNAPQAGDVVKVAQIWMSEYAGAARVVGSAT